MNLYEHHPISYKILYQPSVPTDKKLPSSHDSRSKALPTCQKQATFTLAVLRYDCCVNIKSCFGNFNFSFWLLQPATWCIAVQDHSSEKHHKQMQYFGRRTSGHLSKSLLILRDFKAAEDNGTILLEILHQNTTSEHMAHIICMLTKANSKAFPPSFVFSLCFISSIWQDC